MAVVGDREHHLAVPPLELDAGRRAAVLERYFASLVAQGVGLWVGVQAIINMGVNMGILPTKGLTLPLMSYGGSSIMVTLGWLGLMFRIHHEASVTGRLAVPRKERSRE